MADEVKKRSPGTFRDVRTIGKGLLAETRGAQQRAKERRERLAERARARREPEAGEREEEVARPQRAPERGIPPSARDGEAFKNLEGIYKESGATLNEAELDGLKESPPEKPRFPFFILSVAVLKDILDGVLAIVGVGLILSTFLALPLALVLFFWYFHKLSSFQRIGIRGGSRILGKILARYLRNRAIGAVILGAIPVVSIAPWETFFVILAYNKEKKIVQMAIDVLQAINKASKGQYVSAVAKAHRELFAIARVPQRIGERRAHSRERKHHTPFRYVFECNVHTRPSAHGGRLSF